MEPVSIRSYREGDEVQISRLYEKCYSRYAGHIPRTPEFWRWFNLDRPGVGKEGVFVAEQRDQIVGCLALAQNGEVLDACYDTDHDGATIVMELLRVAEKRAVERGCERLVINVPSDNAPMLAACTALKMRRKQLLRTFSISLTNRSEVLRLVLARGDPLKGTYLLNVIQKNGTSQSLVIRIDERGVTVTEGCSAGISITIDEGTLSRIIFTRGPGLRDWVHRRVSFSPLWRAREVMRFLKALRVGSVWFVPRGAMF